MLVLWFGLTAELKIALALKSPQMQHDYRSRIYRIQDICNEKEFKSHESQS